MSHAIAIKGPTIEKHKKKLIGPRFWCVWVIPQAFYVPFKNIFQNESQINEKI